MQVKHYWVSQLCKDKRYIFKSQIWLKKMLSSGLWTYPPLLCTVLKVLSAFAQPLWVYVKCCVLLAVSCSVWRLPERFWILKLTNTNRQRSHSTETSLCSADSSVTAAVCVCVFSRVCAFCVFLLGCICVFVLRVYVYLCDQVLCVRHKWAWTCKAERQ